MRPAMAMIELIFAIVIIAISVLSIPSMIAVADKATKQITIDDDVMARLSGWTIDKFQARWDGNYSASGSGPLRIAGTADLNCSRGSGMVLYRANPYSTVQCDPIGNPPSTIPGTGTGDGNLTKGVEQLDGGSEPITITPIGGTPYSVTASYAVDYVDSTLNIVANNVASDSWIIGSSGNMRPSTSGTSHLKRVVTRFASPDVNITLTFFKSNKGN
jgi:hypothetical protein